MQEKNFHSTWPHTSVLLEEILLAVSDSSLHRVLDGTCGAGGHSKAILEAHPEIQQLVACDQDESALAIAQERLLDFSSKTKFMLKNFSKLENDNPFDLIVLDLGVSSMQLDTPDRGFSFRFDAPLDMRMNQNQTLMAEDVVNSYPKEELARILYEYGEEHSSRKIAQKIWEARRKKRITTTFELVALIEEVLPRRGKIHPATKSFQALRIEVNRELKVLEEGIEHLAQMLAPGGIFAIITFHSLEDRIVKQLFRTLASGENFTLPCKKPIVPSDLEMRANPRSRSAKLRLLQKR